MSEALTEARLQGKAIANAQVADRRRSIPYRPEYNRITGNVINTLVLQQIWYWWSIKGRKPFYKFRAPCSADRYKEGDSWTEELDITGYRFDKALSEIATKITKGVSKDEARENSLVIYWTDSDRLTWYEVNEDLLFTLIGLAYEAPELLDDSDFQNYLGSSEIHNFLENLGNPNYIPSEITTENTSENTSTHSSERRPRRSPERENTDPGENEERGVKDLEPYELKMLGRSDDFYDTGEDEEENHQGPKTFDPDEYTPGQDEGPAPTLSSRNAEYKKNMKPTTKLQKHFLKTLRHKRFKPGIKSKLNALARAFQEGERLGNDVYQICARALDGLPAQLDPDDLPPMPHNWYWYRCEHADGSRVHIRRAIDRPSAETCNGGIEATVVYPASDLGSRQDSGQAGFPSVSCWRTGGQTRKEVQSTCTSNRVP